MRTRIMNQYFIPILAILVLASGLVVGCGQKSKTPISPSPEQGSDLPKEKEETLFTLAYEAGYSWGYFLMAENKDRNDLFWTPPDRVDAVQKLHPRDNIRDFYIPKGYWTMEDVANAHFPDGTPYSDKQKKQAIEANNWGFYTGFMDGGKDWLKGEPYRRFP